MNLWQHWHRVILVSFNQYIVIIVELIIFCSGYAGWIVVCCVGGLMKDRSDVYRHWICIS